MKPLLPAGFMKKLEAEASGIRHGRVLIEIHFRDARPSRFVLTREVSLFAADVDMEV